MKATPGGGSPLRTPVASPEYPRRFLLLAYSSTLTSCCSLPARTFSETTGFGDCQWTLMLTVLSRYWAFTWVISGFPPAWQNIGRRTKRGGAIQRHHWDFMDISLLSGKNLSPEIPSASFPPLT